jgi:hypothetical protein
MGVVKYIKVGTVKNKYNIKNTAVVRSHWVGNEWVGRVEGMLRRTGAVDGFAGRGRLP